MKKLVIMLAVIFMTGLSANSREIYYMGGHPSYVRGAGGMHRSINNFGSNALFAPKTVHLTSRKASAEVDRRRYARYSATNGYARPYGYYNRPIATRVVAPVQISRLSKNYQISTNPRGHLRNGVIYYD